MSSFLIQQVFNALAIGSLYGLIALGYTMVYGVLRLINFVHGDLFMLAAYLCLAGLFLLSGEYLPPYLMIALAFVAIFTIIGGIGVAIERIAYRPLRNSSRLGPLLSALGLSMALQAGVQIAWGPQPQSFPSLLPAGRFELGGATVALSQILITVLALVLLAGLYLFTERTRLGISIRAVSENPRTSAMMGINVNYCISTVFFVGGGLGAVAGLLYASYYGVSSPTMGLIVGLKAFTAAILGGIGSIPGAMLGGVLLGFLEVFGSTFLPIISNGAIGSEYRDIFAFTTLVLILLFKPSGLLGETVSEESTVYKSDF